MPGHLVDPTPSDKSEKSLATFLSKNPSKIIEGTAVGLIARFIAWPLERTAYDFMAQIKVNPTERTSYWSFLKNNFKFERLLETTNIFKHAGFTQTIGKSLSNAGVWNYVHSNPEYHHLTPTQKGMKIALYGSILEAITTAPGEYKKFNSFHGKHIELHYFSLQYGRIFGSTLVRSLWSTHVLYIGIFQTEDKMKQLFPDYAKHPLLSPISAMLWTVAAQTLIMPTIHFQNYVYENQQQSFFQSLKGFYQNYKIKEWRYGWTARGVNRGCMNFINALGMNACHRLFHHQHTPASTDENEADHKNRKSV